MSGFNFCTTTPRLAITTYNITNESHIAFVLELYKEYTKIDEDGNVKPLIPDRAAAVAFMENRIVQVESTGYGRYLISVLPPADAGSTDHDLEQRVQNATPVGHVTLNLRGPGTPPLPDIGFNLLPSARGKGYATEAAEGLAGWYEREKGVTEMLGYCDDDNEASVKTLKRLGFELLGERKLSQWTDPGSAHLYHVQTAPVLVWTRGLKKDPKEYGL